MNIRNKSNIGFVVFFILFIVTAFSGIKGVGIVSDSLNFVTTKAWDAADGAMDERGVLDMVHVVVLDVGQHFGKDVELPIRAVVRWGGRDPAESHDQAQR